MKLTEKQKSDLSYLQEVQYHGEHVILQAIGTKEDYYKYVWKEKAVAEFSLSLSKPAPDWQCDC